MLFGHHRAWLELIADVLRDAVEQKEIDDLAVEDAAFQIDAMLMAANIELRAGDAAAADRVRRSVDGSSPLVAIRDERRDHTRPPRTPAHR